MNQATNQEEEMEQTITRLCSDSEHTMPVLPPEENLKQKWQERTEYDFTTDRGSLW